MLPQFTAERVADPALNAFIARVDVEVDPEMDAVYPARYAGIVTIHLKDGRTLRKRVDFSKGMPENRMSGDEVEAKFLSLAAAAVGEREAAALLPALNDAFDAPNLAPLMRRIGQLKLIG